MSLDIDPNVLGPVVQERGQRFGFETTSVISWVF